jgi:hypothetical protein
MNNKFAVNLNEYATVTVRCPSCRAKYQLRLRYDHSVLAQKENGEILINCSTCAAAKRLGRDNFEIKSKEAD